MVLRKPSFGLGASGEFLRKSNHLLRTISSQPGPGGGSGSAAGSGSQGQQGHGRPERTKSQSDSHHERAERAQAQRSMSLAAGCWGRSGSAKQDKLDPAAFNPKN